MGKEQQHTPSDVAETAVTASYPPDSPCNRITIHAVAWLSARVMRPLGAVFRPFSDTTGEVYPHAWVYTYHLFYPW